MPFTIGTLTLVVTDTSVSPTPSAAVVVSGATPGATVNVYRSAWSAQAGQRAWVLAVSGVASGAGVATLTDLPAAFGYYEWLAVELAGGNGVAQSTIYYGALSDTAARAVWDRCVVATKNVVDSLLLPDLSAAKVVERWYPGVFPNFTPTPPCVLIAPFGAETYQNRLNNKDDVGYPVIVCPVDAVDRESRKNMTRDLLWREKIAKALRFQRLTGVSEVFDSDMTPEVIVNPDAWEHGLIVSPMLFVFISRELRGVGV